jgi:hypothetical protein
MVMLKTSVEKPLPLPHEALHGAATSQAPTQSTGHGSLLLQLGKRSVPLTASQLPLYNASVITLKYSVL